MSQLKKMNIVRKKCLGYKNVLQSEKWVAFKKVSHSQKSGSQLEKNNAVREMYQS